MPTTPVAPRPESLRGGMLPPDLAACLRDLDGVLTPTALLHRAAWKDAAAPHQAAVFEDALAGVAAGRAGAFGPVVGIDRTGHADALLASGADLVVSDLEELLEEP